MYVGRTGSRWNSVQFRHAFFFTGCFTSSSCNLPIDYDKYFIYSVPSFWGLDDNANKLGLISLLKAFSFKSLTFFSNVKVSSLLTYLPSLYLYSSITNQWTPLSSAPENRAVSLQKYCFSLSYSLPSFLYLLTFFFC